MTYNNVNYWRTIHRTHLAEIQTVGHPWLSEAFNLIKYSSEAETLSLLLRNFLEISDAETTFQFLDIGAGSGYWTHLLSQWLHTKKKTVRATGLDLSPDALDKLTRRLPWVETLCADLRTISPDKFEDRFDLVSAFYCLHHLVRISDFLNALKFAARSVKPGGFLLLMDPVLTRPYSRFATIDFKTWGGNGIPRHLYLIDDLLAECGFMRCKILPAVSFILNGPIEASGFISYNFLQVIWNILQFIGRSQGCSRMMAYSLIKLDRWLKFKHLSFSSSLCLYRRALKR